MEFKTSPATIEGGERTVMLESSSVSLIANVTLEANTVLLAWCKDGVLHQYLIFDLLEGWKLLGCCGTSWSWSVGSDFLSVAPCPALTPACSCSSPPPPLPRCPCPPRLGASPQAFHHLWLLCHLPRYLPGLQQLHLLLHPFHSLIFL